MSVGRVLLQHGARLDLWDNQGKTAYHFASTSFRQLLRNPPAIVIPWTPLTHCRFRAPFHERVVLWLCIAKRLQLPRGVALMIPAWLAAAYKQQ